MEKNQEKIGMVDGNIGAVFRVQGAFPNLELSAYLNEK